MGSGGRDDAPRYERQGRQPSENRGSSDRGSVPGTGTDDRAGSPGTRSGRPSSPGRDERGPGPETPSGSSRPLSHPERKLAILASAAVQGIGLAVFLGTEFVTPGLGVWLLGGAVAGWFGVSGNESAANVVLSTIGLFVVGSIAVVGYNSYVSGTMTAKFFLVELFGIWILYGLASYALIPLVLVAVGAGKLGGLIEKR